MKTRLLVALLLVTFSTAVLADDTFTRTLGTTAQPDLYVSNGSGDIHVFAGTGNEIRIVGHIHVGWSAFGDVRARVQQIMQNPPITQAGNTVHIGDVDNRSLFNNISIDYEIAVPPNVALNLHSGSGDLQIDNVARYLSAGSGSGDIRARGVHGPAELGTGSGDIELDENGVGDVQAKSGSGSIRIHNMDGSLKVRTGSGDINVDGELTGPSSIGTGSGSVQIHIPGNTPFNLEASTGSGDIHVNLPGAPQQSDDSRHHVTASINGGGAPLQVRTGSGDITISPR